jgi:hypothetical protein
MAKYIAKSGLLMGQNEWTDLETGKARKGGRVAPGQEFQTETLPDKFKPLVEALKTDSGKGKK